MQKDHRGKPLITITYGRAGLVQLQWVSIGCKLLKMRSEGLAVVQKEKKSRCRYNSEVPLAT